MKSSCPFKEGETVVWWRIALRRYELHVWNGQDTLLYENYIVRWKVRTPTKLELRVLPHEY